MNTSSTHQIGVSTFDYLNLITRYVRDYKEMSEVMASIILRTKPKKALDLGSGVGNIEKVLLDSDEELEIDCVDHSSEMMSDAKKNLLGYGERVRYFQDDVLEFNFQSGYDVIFTNLLLNNFPFRDKTKIINSCLGSLNEGGDFVWGDLVAYEDPDKNKESFNKRKRFAVLMGEDPTSDTYISTFFREQFLNHKLTPSLTLDFLSEVGFKNPQQVYQHDNFGVFLAQK